MDSGRDDPITTQQLPRKSVPASNGLASAPRTYSRTDSPISLKVNQGWMNSMTTSVGTVMPHATPVNPYRPAQWLLSRTPATP
jgi:hypothetical protein